MKMRDALKIRAVQKQVDTRWLDPQVVRRVVEERGGKLT